MSRVVGLNPAAATKLEITTWCANRCAKGWYSELVWFKGLLRRSALPLAQAKSVDHNEAATFRRGDLHTRRFMGLHTQSTYTIYIHNLYCPWV